MTLEELKRLLAEADEADPNVDPTLYTEFRNALPELIAIAERTKGGALQELMQIDADSYAAGRADQRKADVEIARNLAMTADARLEGADGDDFAHLNGMVDAGLSIAKAIEEQGK